MSWTNPANPFDVEISEALRKNKQIVAIATKSKSVPKKTKKRKKRKRLITIFKVSKSGKIKPKTIEVDSETYRLIKANQDYKPKPKKIWLPKCIRNDLRIKRYFS